MLAELATHLLLGEACKAGCVAGSGSIQGLAIRAQHGALLSRCLTRLYDGCMPLLAPLNASRHALHREVPTHNPQTNMVLKPPDSAQNHLSARE
jgi:hypothetical protein